MTSAAQFGASDGSGYGNVEALWTFVIAGNEQTVGDQLTDGW